MKSYWNISPKIPRFPRLEKSLTVDVVVIGGGITGVTAAYLLKRAGCSVALFERDRFGAADTGHTSASDLCHGPASQSTGQTVWTRPRQAAWDAGRAAIDVIDDNIKREEIACDFAWVPGYLHAPRGDSSKGVGKELQQDAQLAAELNVEASYVDSVPFMGTPGVRFANQARFHPLKYLAGLLEHLPGPKCHVFEDTEVSEVHERPLAVKANDQKVGCEYLVIATHVPLAGNAGMIGAALFQSKLAPYTSYVVGATVPRGTVPVALFWDTCDPYHYLRVDEHARHDYVIFGGEDHKTGQEDDPAERFRRLEQLLIAQVAGAKVKHRWSGQVIETNDGLPFIGETAERQFVATGYAGNGMTFGTIGAVMACDAALGRKNPWQPLFDVSRKKLLGGTWDYVKENLDYPYYMIKDRLFAAENKSLRNVKRGTAAILRVAGARGRLPR